MDGGTTRPPLSDSRCVSQNSGPQLSGDAAVLIAPHRKPLSLTSPSLLSDTGSARHCLRKVVHFPSRRPMRDELQPKPPMEHAINAVPPNNNAADESQEPQKGPP